MIPKHAPTAPSEIVVSLGTRVFGAGGIGVDIVGIAYAKFADFWQPIQSLGEVPNPTTLALGFAAGFFISGVAVQFRTSARLGVLGLACLHAISCFLWLPRIIAFPGMLGCWQGLAQELSLVTAGIVGLALLYTSNAPDKPLVSKITSIGLVLYGVCVVSYGSVHFTAVEATSQMVPKWIPPSPTFWALATGIFDFLAAIAIFTGIWSRFATRLLTVMIVAFDVLIWLPKIFTDPHSHITWAGNAMNLCFIGAVWIVADWFSASGRRHFGLFGAMAVRTASK